MGDRGNGLEGRIAGPRETWEKIHLSEDSPAFEAVAWSEGHEKATSTCGENMNAARIHLSVTGTKSVRDRAGV
jgi:hypothetical protein